MFKRVRWMGMGAIAGVGAASWAQRRVRRTLDEHPVIQAGAGMAVTAHHVGREVLAAVADGRRAMVEREAALRSELAARTDPAAGIGPGPAARPDRVRRAAFPGAPAARVVGEGAPRLRVVEATSSARRVPARPGKEVPPVR